MAEFVEVMQQKKRMCEALKPDCSSCGLCSDNNNYHIGCNKFILDYYEQSEEIIMKWAKENPVKTNADKFKEVFGVEPNENTCPYTIEKCDGKHCSHLCDKYDFWNKEYKEPKGENNDRTKEQFRKDF